MASEGAPNYAAPGARPDSLAAHSSAFNATNRRRLLRFAVVGVSNTLVTLVVYAVLIGLGVSYPPAAIVSYGAGVANGYTWNRRWTFEAGGFQLPHLAKYILVQGAGLALNLGGLVYGVEVLGWSKVVSELATLVPIFLLTFSFNRWWTFRNR